MSIDDWKTKVKPSFDELINSLCKEDIIAEDQAVKMRNKISLY